MLQYQPSRHRYDCPLVKTVKCKHNLSTCHNAIPWIHSQCYYLMKTLAHYKCRNCTEMPKCFIHTTMTFSAPQQVYIWWKLSQQFSFGAIATISVVVRKEHWSPIDELHFRLLYTVIQQIGETLGRYIKSITCSKFQKKIILFLLNKQLFYSMKFIVIFILFLPEMCYTQFPV